MGPSKILEKILRTTEKFIPKKLYRFFQPAYHYLLAITGSIRYNFPSKEIYIVAVTGTKGKTTTVEIINSILEKAGYKTALSSTLRIKIGDESKRNLYKMSVPGRFFLNRFLRKAVTEGCQYAVIELTSEASKQFRHKFIDLNALVFTNISPEHIESHGSFENYLAAKLELAKQVERSLSRPRTIVANIDDVHGRDFLSIQAEDRIGFRLRDAEPYTLKNESSTISFMGTSIHSQLPGEFNINNILAASYFAHSHGIDLKHIKEGVESVKQVDGRMDRVEAGQDFTVIVDYAHTSDSLEAVYKTFDKQKKICVLGNAGGGRDTWKRPEMAKIAEKYCEKIFLTDEDPYDEDPREIVDAMAEAITQKDKLEIDMDRRSAIRKALKSANKESVVLITGKGTDPFIMRTTGNHEPWSDKDVAEEELRKLV